MSMMNSSWHHTLSIYSPYSPFLEPFVTSKQANPNHSRGWLEFFPHSNLTPLFFFSFFSFSSSGTTSTSTSTFSSSSRSLYRSPGWSVVCIVTPLRVFSAHMFLEGVRERSPTNCLLPNRSILHICIFEDWRSFSFHGSSSNGGWDGQSFYSQSSIPVWLIIVIVIVIVNQFHLHYHWRGRGRRRRRIHTRWYIPLQITSSIFSIPLPSIHPIQYHLSSKTPRVAFPYETLRDDSLLWIVVAEECEFHHGFVVASFSFRCFDEWGFEWLLWLWYNPRYQCSFLTPVPI